MNDLYIKVKVFPDGRYPEKSDKGDYFDLFAAGDYEYKAGDNIRIRLGIAMKLPDGYVAHLYPRSSTFSKTGLLMTNSVGIIDNSYSGDNDEWLFSGYATRDGKVSHAQKIAQFCLVPIVPIEGFIGASHLDDEDRGGFGSTGD